MFLPLLLLSHALAGPCTTEQADFSQASPRGVASAYVALAACDPQAARDATEDAFHRVLTGEAGDRVMRQAIALGQDDLTRAWLQGLEAGDRCHALKHLGSACGEDALVAAFLVNSIPALHERFWDERWYRAFTCCPRPEVQEILTQKVQHPGRDRSQYLGILEVFAQNMGIKAIPYLKTALIMATDDDEATYVVNVFSDAAGVGSLNGPDPAAQEAAIQAIFELAPQMPTRAVIQARTTLNALGAQDRTGALAASLYRDRMADDGRLHYGVVVLETATCKNDQVRIAVHRGLATEPGQRWPEAVKQLVEQRAPQSWELRLAEKCKGQGQNEVFVSDEPMAPDALELWQDRVHSKAIERHPGKLLVIEEPQIDL